MSDMQSFLMHYGIKGQKHGIRRFQNEDGSLTAEGKDRYGVGDGVRFPMKGIQKPSFTSDGKIHYGRIAAGAAKNTINKRAQSQKDQKKVDADFNRRIKEAGIEKRLSEKNKETLSLYSRGTQKKIMKYMKKNPKMTFKQADEKESRSSLTKSVAAAGILLGGGLLAQKKITKNAGKTLGSLSGGRGHSICMAGNDFIKMMYGRSQWGKGL